MNVKQFTEALTNPKGRRGAHLRPKRLEKHSSSAFSLHGNVKSGVRIPSSRDMS